MNKLNIRGIEHLIKNVTGHKCTKSFYQLPCSICSPAHQMYACFKLISPRVVISWGPKTSRQINH